MTTRCICPDGLATVPRCPAWALTVGTSGREYVHPLRPGPAGSSVAITERNAPSRFSAIHRHRYYRNN